LGPFERAGFDQWTFSNVIPGGNEENHEDYQDTLSRDRDFNPGPSEYEAEPLRLIILKVFFSGNKAAGT
jgi:hypothetical protein